MPEKVRPDHVWRDGTCRRCGLHEEMVWLLDDQDRPVLSLVWSTPAQVVRVRPFPYMRGVWPADPLRHHPRQRLDEAYPGVRIGRTPPCRAPERVGHAGRSA